MIYDTGIAAIRNSGGFDNRGFYAVGQYGIDIAGPFDNESDAVKCVFDYINTHPAKTVESGKPYLIQ